MFTSNILMAALDGHIISNSMPDNTPMFEGFKIIDDDNCILQKDYLHIGSAKALYSAVRNEWDRESVYSIVITDSDEVMDFFNESQNFHVIVSDLSLSTIINKLSEFSDEYNRVYSLKRHLHSSVSVSDPIIEGAARALKADVIYFSGRLRAISICRTVNCDLFSYININEHLTQEHASMLKDEWQVLDDWLVRFSPLEYDNRISGYLLVIMHNNSKEKFNSELFDLLKESMTEYIVMSFSDRSVTDARFTTLVMDLIDGKISDRETLNERLRRIPTSLTGHFFMILLEDEDITERISGEVIPTLTTILPGSYPVQYDNKLAVLMQVEKYSPVIEIDEDALTKCLEEYKLYACMGNITRNLMSIRADYDKCTKCLAFARTFCEDKTKRLFRAEEYAMYNVIDICYNAVKSEYHGDYIKLCCPGAITLNYYDNIHGTNNAELLKVYLLNDCNTTKTASDFGLHRNTLMYRLEKIQKILGTDLDDPMQKFRMLFSLMTLDYIEKYQKRKTIYTPASDMDRTEN